MTLGVHVLRRQSALTSKQRMTNRRVRLLIAWTEAAIVLGLVASVWLGERTPRSNSQPKPFGKEASVVCPPPLYGYFFERNSWEYYRL